MKPRSGWRKCSKCQKVCFLLHGDNLVCSVCKNPGDAVYRYVPKPKTQEQIRRYVARARARKELKSQERFMRIILEEEKYQPAKVSKFQSKQELLERLEKINSRLSEAEIPEKEERLLFDEKRRITAQIRNSRNY